MTYTIFFYHKDNTFGVLKENTMTDFYRIMYNAHQLEQIGAPVSIPVRFEFYAEEA